MRWWKAASPDVCIDLRERLAPYAPDPESEPPDRSEELVGATDAGPYRPRHLAR